LWCSRCRQHRLSRLRSNLSMPFLLWSFSDPTNNCLRRRESSSDCLRRWESSWAPSW
jgi:hypothetical protein